MAKIIKLRQEHLDQCFEAVQAQADKRLPDGIVDFKRVFLVKDRKATVYFKPGAWLKMASLLNTFEKEVGWYGVASRLGEEDEDKYLIEDIVVYPQEVTAATVDMAEPEEMTKWRMEHIDDEKFDRLYMHGHSHVRMGTSPSGVDLGHQQEVLNQMAEDGFYIFMIYNKRLERTIRIYDLKKNIQFENQDITTGFWDEDTDYEQFIEEAKGLVKDHSYVYKPNTTAPAATGQQTPTPSYRTPTYKDNAETAPATGKPAPEKPAAAKSASSEPVQGMGWKGSNYRGNRFYDYDDDADEIYDAEMGWIPRSVYHQLIDAGYYD